MSKHLQVKDLYGLRFTVKVGKNIWFYKRTDPVVPGRIGVGIWYQKGWGKTADITRFFTVDMPEGFTKEDIAKIIRTHGGL